jgi:hypothetical protein
MNDSVVEVIITQRSGATVTMNGRLHSAKVDNHWSDDVMPRLLASIGTVKFEVMSYVVKKGEQ